MFLGNFPTSFACYLSTRIMNNCILLPIEAESQDTALRIFSTLNSHGKSLSDADIFKVQFYKFYSTAGKKDEFIKRWKSLEELCERIFSPFPALRWMSFSQIYVFRPRQDGIKSSTTEVLQKFYEKDSYVLLRNGEIFRDLIVPAHFWEDVSNQSKDRFSSRLLFVLNYSLNSMWTYCVSVYFI